jgi:hypothetical protein
MLSWRQTCCSAKEKDLKEEQGRVDRDVSKVVVKLVRVFFLFFFFAIPVFELRVFTLSYSTSPIFVKGFSR